MIEKIKKEIEEIHKGTKDKICINNSDFDLLNKNFRFPDLIRTFDKNTNEELFYTFLFPGYQITIDPSISQGNYEIR